MIKLQGNHEIFSFVEELQQALYQLNIISYSHIANIGGFLGKTKKYLQKKIVNLTIFSKLHTIYICNFT